MNKTARIDDKVNANHRDVERHLPVSFQDLGGTLGLAGSSCEIAAATTFLAIFPLRLFPAKGVPSSVFSLRCQVILIYMSAEDL